jgi:hypothetical protein
MCTVFPFVINYCLRRMRQPMAAMTIVVSGERRLKKQ